MIQHQRHRFPAKTKHMLCRKFFQIPPSDKCCRTGSLQVHFLHKVAKQSSNPNSNLCILYFSSERPYVYFITNLPLISTHSFLEYQHTSWIWWRISGSLHKGYITCQIQEKRSTFLVGWEITEPIKHNKVTPQYTLELVPWLLSPTLIPMNAQVSYTKWWHIPIALTDSLHMFQITWALYDT